MRNQKWLRPVRILVGLFFFAGFLIIFSDVKAKLPPGLYNVLSSFQFIASGIKLFTVPTLLSGVFILLVILTLTGGRIYCSTFCPLGILQDILAYFDFITLPFKSQRKKFKKALNYIRYPILAAFVLSWLFLGIIAVSWLDPYSTFGRMAGSLFQPLFVFLNNGLAKLFASGDVEQINALVNTGPLSPFVLLGDKADVSGMHSLSIWMHPVTLLTASGFFFLILILVIYQDRLYCNTICPVGTFLGLLSKFSLFKVRIQQHSCTQCGKCQLVCKARCINLKEMSIDETRCVACYDCITSCEDDSVGYMFDIPFRAPLAVETSSSKRRFLKSGLLVLASLPLLAAADREPRRKKCQKGKGIGKGESISYRDRGPVSPPGSQCMDEFLSRCIGCQLCISVCPTKVLQPSYREYAQYLEGEDDMRHKLEGMLAPRMDYSVGYCNFDCNRCGHICPTGAIQHLTVEAKKKVQIGVATFREQFCIVCTKGTACGACDEHCPTNAITMVSSECGPDIPSVDPDVCTGCGACEYACPVEDPHPAIFVVSQRVHKKAVEFVAEKAEWEDSGWAF